MFRLGNRDLKNVVLPIGIDQEALALRLAVAGVTYATLLTDINDAMQLKRDSVLTKPVIANAIAMTAQIEVYYGSGSTDGFEEKTEYGEADEQYVDEVGHMMPVKAYDRKLGWSEDYLKKARRSQLDTDITNATADYEDLAEKLAIRALFRSTALTGKQFGLGQGGKAVPFCDAGRCGIPYTPPRGRNGRKFDESHDHFMRLPDISQASLELVVENLWEHGHDGPYTALVSDDDLLKWMDKTKLNFIVNPQNGVIYGANETLASVGPEFVGIITTRRGTVQVMTNGRVDTNHFNLHKSYGKDDPRNPIWAFEAADGSAAPVIKVPTARVLPIQGAVIVVELGFNVGQDRTNGVSVSVGAMGSYTEPVNLMS